ncbi:MAG: hypothetical protein Mars2KO_31800 [Maribacter sp.]
MNRQLLLILLVLGFACKERRELGTRSADRVETYCDRHRIVQEGNLEGVVELDSVLKPNTYAIGPIEGLKGEITVYNGLTSISKVMDGRPYISGSRKTKAIFLIKSEVSKWEKFETRQELRGLDEIEDEIKSLLVSSSRDTSVAVPFRIEALLPYLKYHIIFKSDTLAHNMTEHHKAKKMFTLKGVTANILGFWMDEERVGRFTHPGKRTHLHFIDKDNSNSGHIDDIILPANSSIYLPDILFEQKNIH